MWHYLYSLDNQELKKDMIKKLILPLAASVMVLGAIAVNEFTSAGQSESQFKNIEVITEFKEGTHYTTIDEKAVAPYLEPLGIAADQSFEIFSYSCPACLGFESLANAIDSKYKLDMRKIQLGFEGIQLAELDYVINTLLTGKEKSVARLATYDLMLDHAKSIEQKIAIVSNPNELIGIDSSLVTEEIKEASTVYADHTIALADALQLQSTPSIYIKGKYLLNMAEIKSPDNLFRLMEHLKATNKI